MLGAASQRPMQRHWLSAPTTACHLFSWLAGWHHQSVDEGRLHSSHREMPLYLESAGGWLGPMNSPTFLLIASFGKIPSVACRMRCQVCFTDMVR